MLAILGESLIPRSPSRRANSSRAYKSSCAAHLAASDERTALLNPLGASKTKCLVRELNRQLRALARRFEILVSIPGVGETTAAATIVELQEIGTLSAKETPCSAAEPPGRGDRSAGLVRWSGPPGEGVGFVRPPEEEAGRSG
jgi:transposase